MSPKFYKSLLTSSQDIFVSEQDSKYLQNVTKVLVKHCLKHFQELFFENPPAWYIFRPISQLKQKAFPKKFCCENDSEKVF